MAPKWDLRFMEMARLVSTWSKDPSTKVGAVIAAPPNRFVSPGFNGPPHGMPDSREVLENRALKLQCTIHAEENAILFARRPLEGCTMYVYPVPPCGTCAAKILQVGITRVVILSQNSHVNSAEFHQRWRESLEASYLIFEDRVKLDLIDF